MGEHTSIRRCACGGMCSEDNHRCDSCQFGGSKHTPGKWTQYMGDNRIVVAEEDSRLVAILVDDDWDRASGDIDADARLIAAAPELLEALGRVEQRARESGECPFCRHPPEIGCAPACPLTAARAAIKKARGEG